MNLKGFTHRINAIADGVEENSNKLVRVCSLSIDKYAVLATPVDTGRARSNWQVSLEKPITSTREPYAEGKDQSTIGPNTNAALQQASEAVAPRQNGQDVYLTNNLPYIERLNEGWSEQAPAGFVQAAVVSGVRAARRVKLIK